MKKKFKKIVLFLTICLLTQATIAQQKPNASFKTDKVTITYDTDISDFSNNPNDSVANMLGGEFGKKIKQAMGRLNNMKIAFITRNLELTPEEAQKFWPIYNQYEKESIKAHEDNSFKDPLDKEEKMLNIRKKYRTQFATVFEQEKVIKLFELEKKFRETLVERMQFKIEKRRGASGKLDDVSVDVLPKDDLHHEGLNPIVPIELDHILRGSLKPDNKDFGNSYSSRIYNFKENIAKYEKMKNKMQEKANKYKQNLFDSYNNKEIDANQYKELMKILENTIERTKKVSKAAIDNIIIQQKIGLFKSKERFLKELLKHRFPNNFPTLPNENQFLLKSRDEQFLFDMQSDTTNINTRKGTKR